MGGINYDIAAILVLLLNLFLFFSRQRLYVPQTGYFLALILVSLGSAVMDVVGVATYLRVSDHPRWLIYAINTLYYLFQNTVAPVFCVFLLALDGGLYKLRPAARPLLLLPYLAAAAMIASNPATGYVFSFDEAMVYSRGPGLALLYGLAALYAVIAVGSLARERAALSTRSFVGLALFLPFTLVPFVVQFFRPDILVENFGIAVSELLVLLSINDFDVFIDGQTGLFNRAGLVAQLESIGRRRARAKVFLVIIDNKEYLSYAVGLESAGDLEREAVKRLFGRPSRRRYAARLDFGEYAMVLPDPGADSADAERRRLIDACKMPLSLGGRRFALRAKLCEIDVPDEAGDPLVVFQAHRELSRPGSAFPRDSVQGLSRLSLANTGRQLAVAAAVKRAIEGSRLEVHFQPIVSATSGLVVAAESLVRLTDDELGPVGPGEFIPIAERNGSIHAIGDFVVERSCEFLASMRAEGLRLDYLELNLSPVQFAQYNLSERMLALARRSGLSSSDLCFEITETAAALSPLAMMRTAEGLASRGFSVAIDDFGVGNSNFLSLIRLPFGAVKLDRSLVAAADGSNPGRAALAGIVAMLKKVGISLIAEGVETIAQLDALKAMGVDLIQGYIFSRALPPDDFKAFFRQGRTRCS